MAVNEKPTPGLLLLNVGCFIFLVLSGVGVVLVGLSMALPVLR